MFQELHFAIQVLPFIVISFDKCRKMESFSVKGLLHLKYERTRYTFLFKLGLFQHCLVQKDRRNSNQSLFSP